MTTTTTIMTEQQFERMSGLIKTDDQAKLLEAVSGIKHDLLIEGFEKPEISAFLTYIVDMLTK